MLFSPTHPPLSVRSSAAGTASQARRLRARETEALRLTTGCRRDSAALLMGPRRLALLLPLLLLLPTDSKGALGKTHSRNRRGILELAGAIKCSTGRSPFAYLRYGCYCGLGGHGWPKDKVDWCCFKHDCCYSKAEQAGCKPKIQSYNWECEDNAAVCDSLEDKCQKIMCECDRKAAKCLAKAPYYPRYIFWPDFVCGNNHPKCKFW